MHGLLNRTYFQSLLFAIRRVTDGYGLEGDRGVYSLVSLLNDMKENRALLTRANILSARGLPYDWQATIEEERRFVHERDRELLANPPEYFNLTAYQMPDEGGRSQDLHILIDKLSGIPESERSPDDTVRKEIFDGLLVILRNATAKVEPYINKYLAHSATPKSRSTYEGELTPPLVREVDDAVRTICQVAQTTSKMLIDGIVYCFLPLPHGGYLEYIDRPLVSENQVQLLDEELKNYRSETQKWAPYEVEDLVGLIEREAC